MAYGTVEDQQAEQRNEAFRISRANQSELWSASLSTAVLAKSARLQWLLSLQTGSSHVLSCIKESVPERSINTPP